MLTSPRTSIGNYLLKRESGKVNRNRSMINLSGAKTIGILYPLFAIPDYKQVEAFVSELQQQHKEVKALGYLQYKELISRFLPKLAYDFFSQQQVNWYYKPVNKKVHDFIRRDFDLLIDLTMEEHLPLKFIAGLSRARCKVGRFSEENAKFYDLMIKIDPPQRLQEFISQVRHYLTIIRQHE
ncbi:MAG: hypothetical protein ISS17_09890 [Bacteroidales bacterium]|nr:hypothetical protein [Bacteroidales bacterium]